MPQATLSPLVNYDPVKGIDNLTTDDMKLAPGYLRVATNVYIDDEGMLSRRDGVLRSLASGSWKSIWSNKSDLCFGVKNGHLTKINLDWTETTVLSSVGTTRMNYVQVGDRVFFSNLLVVGYILNGVAYGFPTPDRTHRQAMVGGEWIEYYDGRLYAAQGNRVYFSVAYRPMEMDLEKNFLSLHGPISMLKSVSDGLWIGERNTVSFHGGTDPLAFKYKAILEEESVIPGSAVSLGGMDLGAALTGREVRFATDCGVYSGRTSGYIKELTLGHYGIQDAEIGAAMITEHLGFQQYIFMSQAPVETGLISLAAVESGDTA